MAEYCAGVVRVVESAEQGERDLVLSPEMQQAMPFPMVAMLSPLMSARQWAHDYGLKKR